MNILDALINNGIAISRAEARRLLHQGSVCINNKRILTEEKTDLSLLSVKDGDTIQVGNKRTFIIEKE